MTTATSTPEPVSPETADVVVLGLGPGGEAVAGGLADAGMDVVGVDHGLVGGECPFWGCVPSKTMARAADLLAEGHRITGRAGTAMVQPDFAPLARSLHAVTNGWTDGTHVQRLRERGVRVLHGAGRLDGPHTVAITAADGFGEHRVHARIGVVVATGTHPHVPPLPGLADTPYWTNRQAIEAAEAPTSLLVLGGGAVGVELAQVFGRFDTEVTVVESSARLLAAEEPETGELLEQVLADDGVRVLTGRRASAVEHGPSGFTVHLGDDATLHAERLLVATGRRTDLEAVGAADIGVDPAAPALPVDAQMRVAPGVWAVGDITGRGAFTHVAMYQAAIATRSVLNAAGRGSAGPDAEYGALPRVVFTDPEIGAVGMTEAQARERGLAVRTGFTDLADSTRGWIHGARGFVKVVADDDTGTLVGATTAAPAGAGGEVLGALAVAVHAAVPVARLRHMMYAYPTFHRAIESALADLDS